MTDIDLKRGERVNNPGNIDRTNIKWQGMSAKQTDPRFCCFDTPQNGIRAIAKVLLTYQVKYGLHTVRQLISRWAPDTENNTAAYVADVSKRISRGPDVPIHLQDPQQLAAVCKAIIIHENGRCIYSDDAIRKAVEAALAG